MTTRTTATVETLTAEVRVLAVDTRRVTLTLANQLDYVPATDLQAMGRVSLSNGRYLIGRHVKDGTLALASMPKKDWTYRQQAAARASGRGWSWSEQEADPDELAAANARQAVAEALPLIVLGR